MYACLVCGKYFQGRGRNTHAFTHSVQHGHHVFINLRTCRVYCLPDMYEVVDSSLEDIKRALDPRFTPADISRLDKVSKPVGALDQSGKRGVNVQGSGRRGGRSSLRSLRCWVLTEKTVFENFFRRASPEGIEYTQG